MRNALPVVAWTLFFVFAILIMTDHVQVSGFKIVLELLFFTTGILSSMMARVSPPK